MVLPLASIDDQSNCAGIQNVITGRDQPPRVVEKHHTVTICVGRRRMTTYRILAFAIEKTPPSL